MQAAGLLQSDNDLPLFDGRRIGGSSSIERRDQALAKSLRSIVMAKAFPPRPKLGSACGGPANHGPGS